MFQVITTIPTKVFGVTAVNDDGSSRQTLIRRYCRGNVVLRAIAEPENRHDPNAVGIWVSKGRAFVQIGYVGAHLAERISAHLRTRGPVEVRLLDVTGGTRDKPSHGVNIELKLLVGQIQVADVAPDSSAPIVFGWKARDVPGMAWRGLVRFYASLPEWAQPIVWGVGIAAGVGVVAGAIAVAW